MSITDIASLATVKNYLRIPNPQAPAQDDEILLLFAAAAQRAIEKELGHIVRKTVQAERHDGGKPEIWLRELPVLQVGRVEEGWGYYDWELDDQEVNSIPALSIWAYSLDNPAEGLVTRRGPGNVLYPFAQGRNNIRVDYQVGRTEIPGNASLAYCELIAFWYRASQQRTRVQPQGFSPSALVNADFTKTSAETSINMGIPTGILEMLKDGRRRPIIS